MGFADRIVDLYIRRLQTAQDSGNNAKASISVSAAADENIVLAHADGGYDDDTVGGSSLIVKEGGSEIWRAVVHPGTWPMKSFAWLTFGDGNDLDIELAAGGSSVNGYVNCEYAVIKGRNLKE